MNPWQIKERELLAKENAWYRKLSPFMKAVDNHWHYAVGVILLSGLAFFIGLCIGFLL